MARDELSPEKLAVLERRRNVARRYVRGETQWEIARAFEVDQATVSRDLKAVHKEWLAQAVLDDDEITARELGRIDEVERQAWSAWARSQEDAQTLKARRKGRSDETEKTVKGQAGDPRFLELVLKCVERRCRLLGVDRELQRGEDGSRLELVYEIVEADRPPPVAGPPGPAGLLGG